MHLNALVLENFRGFSRVEMTFPENNLSVLFGENGSGKSAILDAIGILLSAKIQKFISYGMSLKNDDIKIGENYCNLILNIGLQQSAEDISINKEFNLIPVHKGSGKDLYLNIHNDDVRLPVIAYYKINRDLISSTSEDSNEGLHMNARSYAHYKAIDSKTNDFQDFINWFRLEEDVENQQKITRRDFSYQTTRLSTIRNALEFFLPMFNPNFKELRVQRYSSEEFDFAKTTKESDLIIQKQDQEIKISQLSSGERSIILLTADIARRAALANPKMENPLESEGVVLIDEIEQHLHPKWQRAVIPALQRTFPNIQFIIATHSPQVLSNVKNGSVFEIENFEVKPRNTYGRDNEWILEAIMDDEPRPKDVQDRIDKYFNLIREDELEQAAQLREELEALIGTDEPEFAKADILLRRKERRIAS